MMESRCYASYDVQTSMEDSAVEVEDWVRQIAGCCRSLAPLLPLGCPSGAPYPGWRMRLVRVGLRRFTEHFPAPLLFPGQE